jgi:hypothetical protein
MVATTMPLACEHGDLNQHAAFSLSAYSDKIIQKRIKSL